MPVYYLDTSALVKRYALEAGTTWMVELTDRSTQHDLFTVRITGPEMIAAIFRKVRTGELGLSAAVRAAADFRVDWQQQYQLVEISVTITDTAMHLAEKHGLRGYDAVHLAAAIELHAVRSAMRLPPLVFVSADDDQLKAAVREGLSSENPNDHVS
jgi:uncharacterized protein